MKDTREKKEDIRKYHLEKLVSSVQVKDIEILNSIKEVPERNLSILKE
jgi:hypothetical protein